MACVLVRVSPAALAQAESISCLNCQRVIRETQICHCPSRCALSSLANRVGWQCGPCTSLLNNMCRKYHLADNIDHMTPEMALDELALRLNFEYVFHRMQATHLRDGTWLHPNLRSEGHTVRMVNLWERAQQGNKELLRKYRWLAPPSKYFWSHPAVTPKQAPVTCLVCSDRV